MIALKPIKNKIIVTVLGLVLFWFFLNITGILKVYTLSTNTMEPNAKKGAKMLVTNIIKPRKNDIVVFDSDNEFFGKQTNVFRLIGVPNDTIKMINGNLFRNGEKVTEIKIAKLYKLSRNEYYHLINKGIVIKDYNIAKTLEDTLLLFLPEKVGKSFDLTDRGFTLSYNYTDNVIKQVYNQNWNKDFFGPLAISPEKYFVLGDNRDNSNDSRFIGLIDKKHIKGVVIFKW